MRLLQERQTCHGTARLFLVWIGDAREGFFVRHFFDMSWVSLALSNGCFGVRIKY